MAAGINNDLIIFNLYLNLLEVLIYIHYYIAVLVLLGTLNTSSIVGSYILLILSSSNLN